MEEKGLGPFWADLVLKGIKAPREEREKDALAPAAQTFNAALTPPSPEGNMTTATDPSGMHAHFLMQRPDSSGQQTSPRAPGRGKPSSRLRSAAAAAAKLVGLKLRTTQHTLPLQKAPSHHTSAVADVEVGKTADVTNADQCCMCCKDECCFGECCGGKCGKSCGRCCGNRCCRCCDDR